MNKKIIIIAIIAIIILSLGGWLFFRSPAPAGEQKTGGSGGFPISDGQGGSGLPGPSPVGGQGGTGTTGGGNVVKMALTQLTQGPISGAMATSTFIKGQVASTTIRYIEKATGNIYEISPLAQDKKRITNTTILKTFESFWSVGANNLVLKYFDEDPSTGLRVKTFSASIEKETASTTPGSLALQGVFLSAGATAVAVSPFENKIFYIAPNGVQSSYIISDFANKKPTFLMTMPYGEFNVTWPNKDSIALLTKPSAEENGNLYLLNAKTGALTKILNDIKGLTAFVSPDADKVIYGRSGNNGIETNIFTISDRSSKNLGIATLPEKCLWSVKNKNIVYCATPTNMPTGKYPDDWYQGMVSFDDAIWKINLATGETNFLMQTGLDVIEPSFDKNENYLFFTNKKDGTLWSLEIAPPPPPPAPVVAPVSATPKVSTPVATTPKPAYDYAAIDKEIEAKLSKIDDLTILNLIASTPYDKRDDAFYGKVKAALDKIK